MGRIAKDNRLNDSIIGIRKSVDTNDLSGLLKSMSPLNSDLIIDGYINGLSKYIDNVFKNMGNVCGNLKEIDENINSIESDSTGIDELFGSKIANDNKIN